MDIHFRLLCLAVIVLLCTIHIESASNTTVLTPTSSSTSTITSTSTSSSTRTITSTSTSTSTKTITSTSTSTSTKTITSTSTSTPTKTSTASSTSTSTKTITSSSTSTSTQTITASSTSTSTQTSTASSTSTSTQTITSTSTSTPTKTSTASSTSTSTITSTSSLTITSSSIPATTSSSATSPSSQASIAQTSATFTQSSLPSLFNGLIDYWSFDNTYLDSVTLLLFSSFSNVGGFASDRNGQPIASVYLGNGYLKLPGAVYFTGDYSTALWMYVRANGYWQSVYLIQSDFFVNFFGLFINSYGYLQVELGTSSTTVNYFYYAISSLSYFNKWTHVGVTLQGTLLSCYIDGLLASSMTLTYQTINTVMRAQSYFGSPQYPLYGYLDEVFFYNRALSATEMSSILTFNYKQTNVSAPTTTSTSTKNPNNVCPEGFVGKSKLVRLIFSYK